MEAIPAIIETPTTTIVLEERCPICEGRRVTETPGWMNFIPLLVSIAREQPDLDDVEVYTTARRQWREAGNVEVPNIHWKCGACMGHGIIPTAAGRIVLDFMRRHGLN